MLKFNVFDEKGIWILTVSHELNNVEQVKDSIRIVYNLCPDNFTIVKDNRKQVKGISS